MSTKTYPMRCRVRAQDGGTTSIEVYDDIGAGGWFSEGLTAKAFTALLADVKGPLDVHINSGGGDVADGIAIGNAIRNYNGFKRTVVDGMAASIASVIMQAGDERVVEPGAMVMIHDPLTGLVGNADEMRKVADTLDKHGDNLASIYAGRAGGTPEHWRDVMKTEAWYTADEAVTAGLADRVGSGAAALPAGLDLAAFTAVPGRIAAVLRTMPRASAPAPAQGAAGDETAVCQTCTGRGTVAHPKTGQNTMQCPGCKGTGLYDPDAGNDEGAPAARHARRVLGMESMPVTDKALPVHHTATEDSAWNGPAAVAAMPNDDTVLEYCHAWQSDEAASVPHREGDDDADDQKGNYKFPHHEHKGGAANVNACSNGLARLSGASIPDADRTGVEAHLRAHLKDAGHGDDDAEDSAHLDLSGVDLEQLGSALKEAIK